MRRDHKSHMRSSHRSVFTFVPNFRGFSLTPNLSKEKRIEKEEEEQTVGELTSSKGNLVANRYDIRSLEWTFMILAFEKHLVWGWICFFLCKRFKDYRFV